MAIFDETGMCVVDTEQIQRRIQAMDTLERKIIEDYSVRFLTDILRLAHSDDMNVVNHVVVDLTKLLKDIIMDYNNPSTTFLKSFKGDRGALPTTNKEKSLGSVIKEIASKTFNPSNILNIMYQHFGARNIDECITKIPTILNNFNPIYLEDAVWLQCCENANCTCTFLPEEVYVNSVPPPVSSLVSFLSCMNHERIYNGVAGFEQAHKTAQKLVAAGPINRLHRSVRFPLKETLLACVGGGAEGVIRAMPLEDRAFLIMVYIFLFFSRYANVSGDMLNRILYVIAIKFILRTAEMLFYEYENATQETDEGLFIKYTVGYLPSVIMAGPFAIEKAYNEWRSEHFTGPILSLVHSNWRTECSIENVKNVSKTLIDKINHLSRRSKFYSDRNRQDCTLGSTRSIRNVENYIPFGLYRVTPSGIESENGSIIGPAKRHSNGKNLSCNSFSVLSALPPLVGLGSSGRGDQTRFELSVFGTKVKDTNCGRLDGFIMCMIDRLFVNKFQNAFSDDERVNEQINQAISQAVSEIMFERNRLVNAYIMNNVYMLPESKNIDCLPVMREGMDVGICSIFMPWKRPVVQSPNIDAMGLTQLELTMSRDPKWAPVLTQLYFFLGRIASQIIHNTVSNLHTSESTLVTESDRNLLIKTMREAIKNVKNDWVREDKPKIGSKRNFSQTSGIPELGGSKANISLNLYKQLREICIEQDWNPVTIIGYADFLMEYCGMLDEFIMSVSTNTSSLNLI